MWKIKELESYYFHFYVSECCPVSMTVTAIYEWCIALNFELTSADF